MSYLDFKPAAKAPACAPIPKAYIHFGYINLNSRLQMEHITVFLAIKMLSSGHMEQNLCGHSFTIFHPLCSLNKTRPPSSSSHYRFGALKSKPHLTLKNVIKNFRVICLSDATGAVCYTTESQGTMASLLQPVFPKCSREPHKNVLKINTNVSIPSRSNNFRHHILENVFPPSYQWNTMSISFWQWKTPPHSQIKHSTMFIIAVLPLGCMFIIFKCSDISLRRYT